MKVCFFSTVNSEGALYTIAMHIIDDIKVLKGGYCMACTMAVIRAALSNFTQQGDDVRIFGTTSRALRISCSVQGHFTSSGNPSEPNSKHLCGDCAKQSDVFRHSSESAKLRALVQRKLWCKFCLHAHTRYFRRQDFFRFLATEFRTIFKRLIKVGRPPRSSAFWKSWQWQIKPDGSAYNTLWWPRPLHIFRAGDFSNAWGREHFTKKRPQAWPFHIFISLVDAYGPSWVNCSICCSQQYQKRFPTFALFYNTFIQKTKDIFQFIMSIFMSTMHFFDYDTR